MLKEAFLHDTQTGSQLMIILSLPLVFQVNAIKFKPL